MKNNFNDCLTRLLKDEGGYSNDPDDNGGATNYGITIVDYRKYINKKGTPLDVKNMKLDDAKKIYKTKYWDALNCDNLSGGVDYTCFDYGVNSGLGRPRKALERFKSLSGTKLIDAINDERMTFLRKIGVGHNAKFMNGWTNRVSRVRAFSHVLADKKDNTSGPATGAVTALSLWALFNNYIHVHPYISTAAAIAIGLTVWSIVHHIRNKK